MSLENDKLYLVINALGIIETKIKERASVSQIKKDIEDRIGYNYQYFNKIFKSIIGCSLDEYIKKVHLLSIYDKWKVKKEKIAQRDTYQDYKYFSYYFKRRFGCSINEVESKGDIVLKETITKEELIRMTEQLDESVFISSYEIKDGKVNVIFDIERVLLEILRFKTYMLPIDLLQELNWNELSIESRRLLLIIFSRKLEEDNDELELFIPEDELVKEYTALEMYDIDNPIVMNGYFVFSKVLDDEFKPVFESFIDSCLNFISIVFPNGPETIKKYEELVDAINKCKGFVTVKRLSEKGNRTEKEIIDTLWEMAQKGLLKLGYN